MMHLPVFLQDLQSLQPGTSYPTWTISLSIPSLSRVSAISFRAVYVQPAAFGLPLMSSAFAIVSLVSAMPATA